MRTYQNLISIAVLLSLIYQPLFTLSAQELKLPAPDVSAPNIEHEKITKEIEEGQPLVISVAATDDTGVESVILYYRVVGDAKFKSLTMVKGDGTDKYSAEIAEDDVRPPSIEYYIEVADLAGNKVLRGYPFLPLEVDVGEREREDGNGKSFFARNWIWIGLGVLAVGGLAAALGGGGGGGGDGGPSTGSVTINTDVPQ